jgi:hypothetical protein
MFQRILPIRHARVQARAASGSPQENADNNNKNEG